MGTNTVGLITAKVINAEATCVVVQGWMRKWSAVSWRSWVQAVLSCSKWPPNRSGEHRTIDHQHSLSFRNATYIRPRASSHRADQASTVLLTISNHA